MLCSIIATEDVKHADIQPVYVVEMLRYMDPGVQEPPLDHLFIAGMPVTRAMLNSVRKFARSFSVGYGSHETGMISALNLSADQIDQYQDFDNGLVLPGVQMRLVDENWRDVKMGEKGRVLVKSRGMFRGYPCDPERTAEKFDKDLWYMTNDVGYVDKSTGHLFVGGRIDSIILHGEYMLYPAWLEEMIAAHPAVQQVVVVPVLDDVLFHAVGACVVRKDNSHVTKDQINQTIAQFVFADRESVFHVTHVWFADDIPRLADGTVDRMRVADLLQDIANREMC
ncbi:uncharacterized protein LOC131957008 [Physella acuta]|uniref:uncharacterized protein LOC131957008 n=1 Tax=Physella acuta TaxID=109671 RepID=UPI0027DC73B7|nr:uncharacterized protein LOC131957008 [Physella acuta]